MDKRLKNRLRRWATATAFAAVTTASALVFAFSAPSARAAVTYAITGKGFGHGVGMGQWGARGLANLGLTHEQILAHYYTGAEVQSMPDSSPEVRVLLKVGRQLTVSGASSANNNIPVDPTASYRIKRRGSQIVLGAAGSKARGTFSGPLKLEGAGQLVLRGRALNGIQNGVYHGSLQVVQSGKRLLQAVNTVGMDSYLKGVVPMEVPASWPPEALMAQAVAAHSYALATKKVDGDFDQYADTRSQVYGGATAEKLSTNQAVDATSSQVVTYEGKVATTYFFSSSGGRTENVENVWPGSKPVPYLVSVDDPYDSGAPYHDWGPLLFTDTELQKKLGGLVKGELKDLQILQTGVSGRVTRANVIGSEGETAVDGSSIRKLLGLRSAWFSISRTES